MFKLQDAFLTSGVFNEALIKRFKESYNFKNGPKLWTIPGHVVYTSGESNSNIYTCDARPLDLLSPSEPSTGHLITTPSLTLDIFFHTQNQTCKMYIVLQNGDVQVFEYRSMLYEWARVGYFNVNITSPNSSTESYHPVIEKAVISPPLDAIYWSEKSSNDDMSYNLQKRSFPSHSVREITQSAVGPVQVLLTNCLNFEIIGISDNLFILPYLPHDVHLYMVLTSRCHLWLFDISGKCLWRGIIGDRPMDFMSLCMKGAGLWNHGGSVKICKALDKRTKLVYLLHDNTLLTILPNGEIKSKTEFDLALNLSSAYFTLWNILCVLLNNYLDIYDLKSGKHIQNIDLNDWPSRNVFYCESQSPCIGFYTDSTILTLQYQSLKDIFSADVPCFSQLMNAVQEENIQLYALMKDLVYNRIDVNTVANLEPFAKVPVNAVQSKALLLCLIQLCREKGIKSDDFPFRKEDTEMLLKADEDINSSNTNLKTMLEPLVELYCKLEEYKNKL